MPRRPRYAPGGLVYDVLNRAVARQTLFEKDADYAAFETVLHEALAKHPTMAIKGVRRAIRGVRTNGTAAPFRD